MTRTKTCMCGKVFEYEVGRGKDRKHCSDECQKKAFKQKQKENYNNLPKCSTPECNNRANRRGAGLCEGCYMRLRRKGTTDYKPSPPYRVQQSAGYIRLREPNHPLADSNGLVYEHRFVFYSNNGEVPFRCHWCGIEINWDNMDIDHIDDDKSNNDIKNLVQSCHKCNTRRGTWKMKATKRNRCKQIEYNGKSQTMSEWARNLGLSNSAFKRRLDLWGLEEAMARPHGASGPKSVNEKG